MVARNANIAPDKRIEFRVGIHLGDVIVENDGDLMGDGVNIAARLEGIAEPGGICLSNAAYEQVRDKIEAEFVDLGDEQLKNIARPVRAYAISPPSGGDRVASHRIDELLPQRPQPRDRAFFVRAREPRITRNIGCEDRRQLSRNLGHRAPAMLHCPRVLDR
jgi:Adenylate and Guanylate cyclase catalytic domain